MSASGLRSTRSARIAYRSCFLSKQYPIHSGRESFLLSARSKPVKELTVDPQQQVKQQIIAKQPDLSGTEIISGC
jgi:hypothetical protein